MTLMRHIRHQVGDAADVPTPVQASRRARPARVTCRGGGHDLLQFLRLIRQGDDAARVPIQASRRASSARAAAR